MRIDDVITLSKAGFTKDDIVALLAPAQTSEPTPTPTPTPAPAPTPTLAPTPTPVQTPLTSEEFQKGLQSLALLTNRFEPPKAESVDDILANIIAPKGVNTNGK